MIAPLHARFVAISVMTAEIATVIPDLFRGPFLKNPRNPAVFVAERVYRRGRGRHGIVGILTHPFHTGEFSTLLLPGESEDRRRGTAPGGYREI